MNRADSAQVTSLIGTITSFALAEYSHIIASLCALVGIAYTIWKWRREIKKARYEDDSF